MSDTPHWRDLLRDRDTLMNAVYPDGMFPDYSDGVNVTLADGSSTHYAGNPRAERRAGSPCGHAP